MIGGNLSVIGAGNDTGEPFLVISDNSVYVKPEYTPDAVSITSMIIPVKMIDAKYIPFDERTVRIYRIDDRIISFSKLKEIASEIMDGKAILNWDNRKICGALYISKSSSGEEQERIEFLEISNSHIQTSIYSPDGNGMCHANTSSSSGVDLFARILRIVDTDNKTYINVTAHYDRDDTDDRFISIGGIRLYENGSIVLTSQTSSSSKMFKIAVDDSGKLTTTQVTGDA